MDMLYIKDTLNHNKVLKAQEMIIKDFKDTAYGI